MNNTDESNLNITYHLDHHARFTYTINRIQDTLPKGSMIADIGCHRLDFAVMLREAGYNVVGVDVPEFLDKESVKERADKYGIHLVKIASLEKGLFSGNFQDHGFDAIVFAEILEHIAFNPLEMWRTLFKKIKPEGGTIILTTPNSLNLKNCIRGFYDIITRSGIGIHVSDIMSIVTYGHHWKEYSRSEIIEYFKHLGVPIEDIFVEYVNYGNNTSNSQIKSFLKKTIFRLFPFFRDDLFVIIRIKPPSPEVPPSPQYLG